MTIDAAYDLVAATTKTMSAAADEVCAAGVEISEIANRIAAGKKVSVRTIDRANARFERAQALLSASLTDDTIARGHLAIARALAAA